MYLGCNKLRERKIGKYGSQDGTQKYGKDRADMFQQMINEKIAWKQRDICHAVIFLGIS